MARVYHTVTLICLFLWVADALMFFSYPHVRRNVLGSSSSLRMNFFKELIEKAFENDTALPSNKNERQIESPNESFVQAQENSVRKSDVQKRWLELKNQSRRSESSVSTSTYMSPMTSRSRGAPMNPALLSNTSWRLSLYLTGVPDFDPSNSLYGSRVNISTRRKSDMAKQGFAIGADTLPDEPTVTVEICLLENGHCSVKPSTFTTGERMGQWKLSEDGRMIRISMDVVGYKRTVTTKGSIQNIYWSDRDEVARKSSATYSIPSGYIFIEGPIGYGNQPGMFCLAESFSDGADPPGIIKIEKEVGFLGASSKLLPCGKFSGEMIIN